MNDPTPFHQDVLKAEPTCHFRWLDRTTLQQKWKLQLRANPAGISFIEEWRDVENVETKES